MKKQQTLGIIYQLIASALFGFSFIAVKLGVDEVAPVTLLAWRFTIAFATMSICALTGLIKINLRGKRIWPVLLMALFQPILYFSGETMGIKLTTASESGTVMACIPIVTLLLATRMLKEKPTKLQAIGIIISVLGVVLVGLAKGLSASLNIAGYLLLVLAMLSDSFYVVFSRKADGFTSMEKTYVMMGCGAFIFTVSAFVFHGFNGTVVEFLTAPFNNIKFLIGLIYLGICCSIVGFFMVNRSIELLGATRASSFAGLSTIIAVLSGVIILGEKFSFLQGVGTAMVMLGVYASNVTPKNSVPVEWSVHDNTTGDNMQ
ncbi:MAG: DMT family transporter [Clostridia bacterium]